MIQISTNAKYKNNISIDRLLFFMNSTNCYFYFNRFIKEKGGSTEIFPTNFKINLFIIKLNNCIN